MRRHQGLHLEKRGRLGPTGVGGGGGPVPPGLGRVQPRDEREEEQRGRWLLQNSSSQPVGW